MILATMRLLTDFLNDATYGVNAKLANLTTLNSDPTPADLVLIADETRNLEASLGRLPESSANYPCLLISQPAVGNQLDPHAHVQLRGASVQVMIRYAQLNSDTVEGNRDAHYTMQCVAQSIEDWFEQADTHRKVSGVMGVQHCESMLLQSVWQPLGDKVNTAAMLVSFRARDILPT